MAVAAAQDERDRSETIPLLSAAADEPASTREPLLSTEARSGLEGKPPQRRWSPTVIATLLQLVVLLAGAADQLEIPAMTRIYEAIYCREYYEAHDPSLLGRDGWVEEGHCKVPMVQGQVAMLKAWAGVFDIVGSLLFAIPWGYFADIHGRKPVLLIIGAAMLARSIWIQIVCYFWNIFPVKLIWLGGLHSLSGGGPVFAAMVFTIMADLFPPEKRAAMFFRISATEFCSKFLFPPVAGALMRTNPFLSTAVGSAVFLAAVFGLFFVPETVNYHTKPASTESSPPSDQEPKSPWTHHSILLFFRSLPSRIASSASFLTSSPSLLLLLPAYAPHLIIPSTLALLPQYASARFDLSLASAALITSIQALLVLAAFLVLLPAATRLLTTRYHWAPSHADLILARFSAIAVSVGFALIGLAPSLPLLIAALPVEVAGYGVMLLVRSVATTLVEPHHVARLYTLLSVVEVATMMGGSPAIAMLFDRGLQIGGAVMGLPFLVVAGLMGGVAVVLGFVRLGEKGVTEREDGDETADDGDRVESGVV